MAIKRELVTNEWRALHAMTSPLKNLSTQQKQKRL